MRVRVSPRARREGILGVRGDVLKVAVRAAPEKGKANAAVAALLSRALSVAAGAVRLLAGAATRDKTFLIEGLDAATARDRLAKFAGDAPP